MWGVGTYPHGAHFLGEGKGLDNYLPKNCALCEHVQPNQITDFTLYHIHINVFAYIILMHMLAKATVAVGVYFYGASTALGITTMKIEQGGIIQFTLGRDVLVAHYLPTGYGKRLCYYSGVELFGKVKKKSIVMIVRPLMAVTFFPFFLAGCCEQYLLEQH